MEAKKGLGQRDAKGATKYFLIFDSWFYSKRLVEAAVGVVEYIVVMV